MCCQCLNANITTRAAVVDYFYNRVIYDFYLITQLFCWSIRIREFVPTTSLNNQSGFHDMKKQNYLTNF